MTIEQLIDQLPDYAKDIKLNFSSILSENGADDLSQKQIYQIALAAAYTTKNINLISVLAEKAADYLSPNEMNGMKAAASIMSMNNIYYRFIHLVSDKTYASMPAKLRMNIIANHGINKIDFELACLAVSAINGCGMCMEAHTNTLVKNNVTKQAIQSTIRIAAVLNATAFSTNLG